MYEPRKLPHPVHTQDEYAYAIAQELRYISRGLQQLNAVIAAAFEAAAMTDSDEVPLRESEKPKARSRDAKRAAAKGKDV